MSARPCKRFKQSSILDCLRLKSDSDRFICVLDTDAVTVNKGRDENIVESVKELPKSSTSADAGVMSLSDTPLQNVKDASAPETTDAWGSTAEYSMSPELTDSGSGSSQSQGSVSETERNHAPSHTSLALGTPLAELRRTPGCSMRLPPIKSTPTHTVMYTLPHIYHGNVPPAPHPSCYDYKRDMWGAHHVRMPCSHHNEYPDNGMAVRRWNLIEKALLQDIKNSVQLQDAILTYNARYSKRWDFSVLHRLFLEEYSAEKTKEFFDKTLKDMVQLALQLPHLCTQPIPMLHTGHCHSLSFSQQQVASLLANAFFCTFPRRNAHHRNSEYAAYPTINFNGLFAGGHIPRKVEKLKCIIHYFTTITQHMPTGCVTYRRQCVHQLPEWENSDKCLTRLHISTGGGIEDEGRGMLQVDFANKYIGGGILGQGCVQEEIRFLICPEMIISKLFTEVLDKNECLIMTGCERFSDYTGYSDTFKWSAGHTDTSPRDDWGRLMTEVVAIDALMVYDYCSQFKMTAVHRELNKAYCGFKNWDIHSGHLPAVCTGNWGCGAFGGDKRLKALIQLMAASQADRDVCFLTFHDEALCRDIQDVHQLLAGLHISDIMLHVEQYYRNVCLKSRGQPLLHIYDYISACMIGYDESDESSQDVPQTKGQDTPQSQGHSGGKHESQDDTTAQH